MRCCPRSPFLSPLWAEMPYHRFGNSVVQHRAHPVETLRRMARRHSRPSPRPYMRTGRSGVRPDGVFISAGIATVDTPLKLGELFEPMSVPAAVTQLFFMMAYGVVEVYVAIYAVLHCLPSEGIYFIGIAVAGTCGGKSGEARLVYTGNAAIITGILLLVFAHNIPCYLLLWQHCWDTVSELCSLPCRPWPCLSKDEVPQALRFSWLSISGLHWEDFSRITREIPGI